MQSKDPKQLQQNKTSSREAVKRNIFHNLRFSMDIFSSKSSHRNFYLELSENISSHFSIRFQKITARSEIYFIASSRLFLSVWTYPYVLRNTRQAYSYVTVKLSVSCFANFPSSHQFLWNKNTVDVGKNTCFVEENLGKILKKQFLEELCDEIWRILIKLGIYIFNE